MLEKHESVQEPFAQPRCPPHAQTHIPAPHANDEQPLQPLHSLLKHLYTPAAHILYVQPAVEVIDLLVYAPPPGGP